MGWRRWGKYKKTRGIPKIEEPTIWDHMLSHEKSFIYIMMSSQANTKTHHKIIMNVSTGSSKTPN